MSLSQPSRAATGGARRGGGPTLIEALTYRQKGHSRTDPGAYRAPGELERWMERDPLLLFGRSLVDDHGVAAEEIERMRAVAETVVRDATERALAWDEPALEERFEDIFV